ncbi:AEC family transporter [Latilactobacillus graminis]|uniref:Membrane transport family protein n=2 Tax=Latilactobacillus graminis TaxID=60519 RepID=A0AA89I480_9LACO|nr:AEC family transporter [Latilactobacillus graminis]KRM21387.1 membrane transport family protein [Latilactobacillus graminis DSM 20719]QFP80003.1 AEC family transporter [Latilactobacillus graminis]
MAAFLTSLSSVVEIVLVIALGFWLRSSKKFDDNFKGTISFLIMNIALPLSIFVSVLDNLTREKLVGLSGGLIYVLISFVLGYVVAWLLTKVFRIRPGRRGTFINMFVNANTIFIGLPLNLALFGDKSLPYFLIYYVANTVSTWAIGVFFISNDDPTKEKGATKDKFNWRKLLPAPLLGFLAALIYLLTGLPLPDLVDKTFSMVGGIVTPMSLIYIGIILADAGLKSIHFDRDTVLALLGRFVVAPAIMIVIMLFFKNTTSIPSIEQNTLIIQAATPGLAVLPILVGQSHGDVEYATNVVTTSTVLFVVVVPILMQIIQYI